ERRADGGPGRAGHRAARAQGARRLLRAGDDQLRGRDLAGEHQLDGADERSAGSAGRAARRAAVAQLADEARVLLPRAARRGAVLFTALPEALREAMAWQWQMLAYGVLLVLLVFFLPRGIVPALRIHRVRAPALPAPSFLGEVSEGASTAPSERKMLTITDLAVAFGGVAALAGVS